MELPFNLTIESLVARAITAATIAYILGEAIPTVQKFFVLTFLWTFIMPYAADVVQRLIEELRGD